MPTYINENPHPIRVPSQEGQVLAIPRIPAGAVVEADGYYADRLSQTAGVREATGDEASAYQERQERRRERNMDPGPALRQAAADQVGPVRQQARLLSVVGPLQRVIGDDTAPYAPPTGTVTTKQAVRREAVASGEMAQAQAFGPNEATYTIEGVEPENPLDATVRTQPAIHNYQALSQVAAEEAANQVIDPTGEGLNVGPDGGDSLSGDYGKANKVQLQAEALRRGIEVEGTGSGGATTKDDLVDALEAHDANQQSTQ